PECIGALDEYGENGELLGEMIVREQPDFIVFAGVPHAVSPEVLTGGIVISSTNGPRQAAPLKSQGHTHVIVELDLHPKTIGVHSIVESEFGAVLRSLQ
ncbi:MAG TPA: Ni-sirohydrochlorin a,c-diamide reductive cyclase catalytic subunit, partial [Methanocorpusculum sp.]|nr:Ni-sirohydrochlorin a,c-diamide reductive cyclase catalytic subunit [Methanocorpusculum sp.]